MSGGRHVELVPADDEWLTQYVFAKDQPQVRPRARDIDGLSLLRGRLSTVDAGRFVRKNARWPYEGDAVRHVLAGDLRRAKLEVTHTPTRTIPGHVSVSCEGDWGDDQSANFDACFGDVVDTHGMEGGDGA